MRDTLDTMFDEIDSKLLKMTELVEENIKKSVEALLTQNSELAQEIIDSDLVINAFETEIEMLSVNLIALQAPAASDLRRVFTALKIVTDLERVGDNCCNICEVVKSLGKYELVKPLIDLPEMANIAKKMVFDSITAYLKRDVKLAKETAKTDDQVDDLYAQVYRDLLKFINNDQSDDQVIGLILVGRYFERIADHATNVCERLIYLETGENVKY